MYDIFFFLNTVKVMRETLKPNTKTVIAIYFNLSFKMCYYYLLINSTAILTLGHCDKLFCPGNEQFDSQSETLGDANFSNF